VLDEAALGDAVSGIRRMTEARPLVSVIVPVFNESETVEAVLTQLIEATHPRADYEIVVVESNSTDGSRDIVQRFASHERVKVVLQDVPRGKGNAVREGFRAATGDILLIQDGDLEYRISEYPLLLDPILDGRNDFVLGCRHIPGQRMRDIPEQPLKGQILNAAHWLFTALFDITYGVRLRDPFTMFKVFRAECIRELDLVADRFDFDWELLGKLIRRGYKPVEIPITYKARSFDDGKKVRMFRDPPTWVAACFRFRFSPLTRPADIGATRSAVGVGVPEGKGSAKLG
jgi:glycosyltransferase involved in cell wall biosynthesis